MGVSKWEPDATQPSEGEGDRGQRRGAGLHIHRTLCADHVHHGGYPCCLQKVALCIIYSSIPLFESILFPILLFVILPSSSRVLAAVP